MLPRGSVIVVDERAFGNPLSFPVKYLRGGKEFNPADYLLASVIVKACIYDDQGSLRIDPDRIPAPYKWLICATYRGVRLVSGLLRRVS